MSGGEAVIIVFKDDVSEAQVATYADDVIKNGGTVKDRYWESGIINGFSATISPQNLESFKSFTGDKIKSIEGDQVVSIQQQ